ncbi:MAG: NYN domain-containing protein [Elusimicrobia bacterium RIFOXYB2_FULL_62_6]|nr:MAG: NYN domain-containing protein [Elusimicrobia bacterium RIFOXYB2_FULL_62_6]
MLFMAACLAGGPVINNAVIFIDGQNLYHSAKEAFGYTFPNYDALALSKKICADNNWTLAGTRFYTGVPDSRDDPFWNKFWAQKLSVMGRQGIVVFKRSLRYRRHRVKLPDGSEQAVLVGEEKGIDVRIAIDIIRSAHAKAYDVAVVFSQDQDLSEVAAEIRAIAREQARWIKIASAFPVSRTVRNPRGIDKTDWIKFDREFYDACIDRRDYLANAA